MQRILNSIKRRQENHYRIGGRQKPHNKFRRQKKRACYHGHIRCHVSHISKRSDTNSEKKETSNTITETYIKDSDYFIFEMAEEKVNSVKLGKNDIVVSLDVKSQFTNVPIEEAIIILQRTQEINTEDDTAALVEF
ncbi:hypothetical protein Trydic_g15089 [Trypoxylus dichotomus]